MCSGRHDKHKEKKKQCNKKRFNRNCRDCGKCGHMAKDFWSNENKRPQWYEKGSRSIETGAVSTDGTPEIELANMDCANECDACNSSDESELRMPKLLARGDDDTRVSSDEGSITECLEDYELPLSITRKCDE